MLRVRFYVPADDFRPVIWPIPLPYWCSGYDGHTGDAILVAYVDSQEQLMAQWPDAYEIEFTSAKQIEFSSRFPQPDWWKPAICV